jgi:hypothetical protein
MTYYDSAGSTRYRTIVATQTSHMELLLILVCAVVVAFASFWAVAAIMDGREERRAEDARLLNAALDQWPRAAPSTAALNSTITVVEATFGMSCKDFVPSPPNQNLVRVGNVTKAIAEACDKKDPNCSYTIDISRLGDPAGGCEKDFTARASAQPVPFGDVEEH